VKDSEQLALAARSTNRRPKETLKQGETPNDHLRALAAERLAVEGVSIEIDGGRFTAKVVAGWPARIEANIFSDGHDLIDAAFIYREAGAE
jgi:starch synthase (maltosyl-transferring)